MSISARTAWYRLRRTSSDQWLFLAFVALFFCMPMGTSPPTICAALVTIIWVFSGRVLKIWDTFLKRKWSWPVLLLIMLPWIGLLYTPDVEGLGIKFAEKTHYWIYCAAASSMVFEDSSPQRFIQAFLGGLAINAIIGIMQFMGLFPVMNEISFGLGLGYNTLSGYLILGMLMSSYYFREANERGYRWFFGLLSLLYFIHLIILQGRAGYLTFLFLCPIMAYNLLKGAGIYRICLVSLLLVGSMLLSPVVRDRIALSIDQVKYHLQADPDSAWGREYTVHQDRFYMWRGAGRIFLEHPVLGVGTGGYQMVLKKMGKPQWPAIAHPHNNILYMAVSFGLVGVFAILWFFWEIMKNAFHERKTPLGFFILSTTLVMFFGGLVNTYIKDAGTLLLLAVVTGLQNGLGEGDPGGPHLRRIRPEGW